MARKASDIGQIDFARSPTPGQGFSLNDRGKIDYTLLKDAPTDGDVLRYLVDDTSGEGQWTADDAFIAVGQRTSDLTVSATAASAATTLISLGSATYRADEVIFELSASRASVPWSSGGNTLFFQMFRTDTSNRLGYITIKLNATASGQEEQSSVYGRMLLTPTAGDHIYGVAVHRSTANCTVFAGVAGTADDDVPAILTARYTGR